MSRWQTPPRGGDPPSRYASPSPARASLNSSQSASYSAAGGGAGAGGVVHSSSPSHGGGSRLFGSPALPSAGSSLSGSPLGASGSSSLFARAPLRRTRTIVVLGFSGVGKTALCVRFVSDRFDESYEPTYENSFVRRFAHRGSELDLLVKDTQGIGEQDSFRSEYSLGVHGYVLVYSVASARSLEVLKTINARLLTLIGSRSVPRVLVASKLDLVLPPGGSPELRQVPTSVGENLAAQWGCAFTECSARHNQGVDRVFSLLLDEIERTSEGSERSTLGAGIGRIILDCIRCRRGDAHGDRLDSSSSAAEDDEESLSLDELSSLCDRRLFWSRLLTWTLLLLSLAGLAACVSMGVRSSDSQVELLAYVLSGLCLLLWLVSLVGLYGLRSHSVDVLRVYAASLGVLLVLQVAAWIALYLNVDAFAEQRVAAIVGGIVALVLQASAAVAARKLANTTDRLAAATSAASPYQDYHHYNTASYHSLYEA